MLCLVRHRALPLLILSLSLCLNSALRSDGESVSTCQTDCSWTSYEVLTRRNEFFQCSVERLTGYYYECPKVETSGTKTFQDRPDPVEDLETEFYLLNTTHYNGVSNHQTCLRVRFTLDPSTADNVQAITVSLISGNYDTLGEILCHNYRFSSNLTYCSVLQDNCDHDRKRIFASECLCDLIPGGSYHLQVRSFPLDELTETQYDATVRKEILVPDCSVISLDWHCPKGLRKWKPFYSVSRQGRDYNSMTTCFSLPPENAETFSVFLYEHEPDSMTSYSLFDYELVDRETVDKLTRMVNGIQYELACVNFTGVKANVTYLPALRLDAEDSSDILPVMYLYQAELFLPNNPCKFQPCGDIADGDCIANGSSHRCVCYEGTIFNGGRCERDKEVPKVENCPSDIQVLSQLGECSAVVDWAPIEASDNSGYVTVEQTHFRKQRFPVGNTSVRYTFTDGVNNIASCVFLVSVIDEEPPVVSPCPQNIIKTVEEGHTHAIVTWYINAQDNCEKVHHNFPLNNSGLSFSVGKSRISVKAWDDGGNSVTCSVDVTIYGVPFNYIRVAIIVGCLLLVSLIIIGLLWRYRKSLEILKSPLRSISGTVYHPASPSGAPGEESSCVRGTMSDETIRPDHLGFEPLTLDGPSDPAVRMCLVERLLEGEPSAQELESLTNSHSSQSNTYSIREVSSTV